MPAVYRAEALLAPAPPVGLYDTESSFFLQRLDAVEILSGQFFGGGESNRTDKALEIIKSRNFLNEFMKRRGVVVPLLAGKAFSLETQDVLLDSNIYDSDKKAWNKGYASKIPIERRAFKKFVELLSVHQDKYSGFIRISITSVSASHSVQWLRWLIDDVNTYMREMEKAEAEAEISNLKRCLSQNNIVGIEPIISLMVESKKNKIALLDINQEFVFMAVDHPMAHEEPIGPRIELFMAASFMAAFLFLLSLLVLFYFYLPFLFSKENVLSSLEK